MIFNGNYENGTLKSPVGKSYTTESVLQSKYEESFTDGGTLSGWFYLHGPQEPNYDILLIGTEKFYIGLTCNNDVFELYGKLSSLAYVIDLSGIEVEANKWTHVCLSKTSTDITLYINGVAVSTSKGSFTGDDIERPVFIHQNNENTSRIDFNGIKVLEYGMSKRDVYNENLGLICQLNCGDPMLSSTVNLAKGCLGVDLVGNCDVTEVTDGWIIDIPENDNSNIVKYYFELGTQELNKTYTISALVDNLSDHEINIHGNITNLTNGTIAIGESELVYGTEQANGTSFQLQVRHYTGDACRVKVTCLQLEEREYYTEYTSEKRDSELELDDVSGFANDFVIPENGVEIVKSDVYGSRALRLNNVSIMNNTIARVEKDFTISLWINLFDAGEIFRAHDESVVISLDLDDKINVSILTTSGLKTLVSESKLAVDEWSMITVVFDGIEQRLYINGELDSSKGNEGELYYGGGERSMIIGSDVYIEVADFRYYGTAIPEEAIYDLSGTVTTIDKTGGIEVMEIIETQENLFNLSNILDYTGYAYDGENLFTKYNGYESYMINPYHFTASLMVNNKIFEGQFSKGSYLFDFAICVDNLFEIGVGANESFAAGIIIHYEGGYDKTSLTVTPNSSNDGFQRLVFQSEPDRTISHIEFYRDVNVGTYFSANSKIIKKTDITSIATRNGGMEASNFEEHNGDFQLQGDGRVKSYNIKEG